MAPTPNAPATGAQAAAQAPPTAPFRAGTFRQVQTDGYSQTVTLSAADSAAYALLAISEQLPARRLAGRYRYRVR